MISCPVLHQSISNDSIPFLREPPVLGGKHQASPTSELLMRKPSAKKLKSTSSRRVCFESVSKADTGRVTLTDEEKELMWWNNETKFQAKLDSISFQKEQADDESSTYTAAFRQALHMCSSNAPLQGAPLISDSPVRGLEQRIFPELMQPRRRAVAMVLKAQRKLPKGASPEQKAALLCALSKKLTKPSRRVARLLAIGDATVAAELK
jgi:hypothetical protein